MSYGFWLEAVYADGYALREQPEDLNPYGPGNTFTAVLSHAAAAHHGPLVRLSLVPDGLAVDWATLESDDGYRLAALVRADLPDGRGAYTVDWTLVPPGAEPVVERRIAALMTQGAGVSQECQLTRFGYRYPDGASTVAVVEEF